MKMHDVRVHPSKADLQRDDQLTWKIAALARPTAWTRPSCVQQSKGTEKAGSAGIF